MIEHAKEGALLELTTKRSNFWYILPIVLGLLGGVIAYFVLRKSDSKKAKICLIIGFGISAVWIGTIANSGTNETNSKVATTEKNEEQRAEEVKVDEKETAKLISDEEMDARFAEMEKRLAELEAQEETDKLVSDEEMDRRLAELESFDPLLVQSAKENIPGMQELPREVLKQCKAVKSLSEYQTFAVALVIMSEDMVEVLNGIDATLILLELGGYDKHPEVGPLIKETRSLAVETGDCIDDLLSRYGN